jgi:Sugar (and other) transporter
VVHVDWIWNFLLSFFAPRIVARIGPLILLIFFGMLVFGFGYVYLFIPETKGLSLEEVCSSRMLDCGGTLFNNGTRLTRCTAQVSSPGTPRHGSHTYWIICTSSRMLWSEREVQRRSERYSSDHEPTI